MNTSSQDPSPYAEKATPDGAATTRFEWTAVRQRQLSELARRGLTGAEIAEKLGITRSAVLGRAFRTGVKLPIDERKRANMRAPVTPKAPREPRRRSVPPDHPSRRKGWGSARAFSDAQIATAIAGRLAGLSFHKAALLIGASAQSLTKNWMNKPELLAQGRALFERAHAAAAIEAARKREIAAFEAEAKRLRIEAVNAPILAQMSDRHLRMMRSRIAGETLQMVGDAFGVTRERVRQIEVTWRLRGLIIPDANPLSDAATRAFGPRPKWPQSAKPQADFYGIAHRALGPIPAKRPMKLSEEERQRRSDWMREVSRRRWEARA